MLGVNVTDCGGTRSPVQLLLRAVGRSVAAFQAARVRFFPNRLSHATVVDFLCLPLLKPASFGGRARLQVLETHPTSTRGRFYPCKVLLDLQHSDGTALPQLQVTTTACVLHFG